MTLGVRPAGLPGHPSTCNPLAAGANIPCHSALRLRARLLLTAGRAAGRAAGPDPSLPRSIRAISQRGSAAWPARRAAARLLELIPQPCHCWPRPPLTPPLLGPQDKVDLGELMLSLCYLPTAGRLTVTIIKARNLKAMDITGSSGEYGQPSRKTGAAELADDSDGVPGAPRGPLGAPRSAPAAAECLSDQAAGGCARLGLFAHLCLTSLLRSPCAA